MEVQTNNEMVDISPKIDDTTPQTTNDYFSEQADGIVPNDRPIQSPGYKINSSGWKLSSSGESELNGAVTVATNFKRVLKMKGLSFYVSNGTTPNGNLTGAAGDICFGADAGKAYYCVSAGTSWTAL